MLLDAFCSRTFPFPATLSPTAKDSALKEPLTLSDTACGPKTLFDPMTVSPEANASNVLESPVTVTPRRPQCYRIPRGRWIRRQ